MLSFQALDWQPIVGQLPGLRNKARIGPFRTCDAAPEPRNAKAGTICDDSGQQILHASSALCRRSTAASSRLDGCAFCSPGPFLPAISGFDFQ